MKCIEPAQDLPCEKCGIVHTVEVSVSAFQGVIHKVTELQARMEKLEAENKGLREQTTKAKNAVLTITKRLVKVFNDPNNQQFSLVLTSSELARIMDIAKKEPNP